MLGYTKDAASYEINNCKNYGVFDIGGGNNKSNGIAGVDVKGEGNSNISGGMDPTYNMVAKYYQVSNKTYEVEGQICYSLRLVALHNGIEDYSNYGYDISITINGKTYTKSTDALTTVNTKINVDTMMGENVTEVYATQLGAEYLSAVCIDDIPVDINEDGTNDAISVTITPKVNGTAISDPITFEVPAFAA